MGPKTHFGFLFYKVSPTPELQFLRLLFQNARRLWQRGFRSTRMYLLLHLLLFASSTGYPQSYGFHIPVLPSLLSHAVET